MDSEDGAGSLTGSEIGVDQVSLIVIGLLAGLLGGLLGIGGSVLMIPAMTLILGPAQHLYQGAAMMVNFFVVLPAVVQHHRAGAIVRPVVRVTIPAAAVSVVVGVALSDGAWFRGVNEVYLSRTFGVFLLYAAAYNVYRLVTNRRSGGASDTDTGPIPTWKIAAGVGVPMGLAGGLLGIGGGVLAVPLQQILLRMPLRRAIANSAATIVALSLIGATYKNCANVQAGVGFAEAAELALFLIPTAVIGGYLGGRLTHVAPMALLRLAVVVLMCYAGIEMIRQKGGAEAVPPIITAATDVATATGEHRPTSRRSCAWAARGPACTGGSGQIG